MGWAICERFTKRSYTGMGLGQGFAGAAVVVAAGDGDQVEGKALHILVLSGAATLDVRGCYNHAHRRFAQHFAAIDALPLASPI